MMGRGVPLEAANGEIVAGWKGRLALCARVDNVARRSKVPTLVTELSNMIMLIGGSGRLLEATQRAASQACGARVVEANLKTASTVAAEFRPFAMIVAKDMYEFGGDEFDALARDVRSELIVVPHSIQAAVLTALIVEAASKLS
jgi:hypothetical protein